MTENFRVKFIKRPFYYNKNNFNVFNIKMLKYIQSVSQQEGLSSQLYKDKLLIQVWDETLSLKERQSKYFHIIRKCHKNNLIYY